MFRDVTKKGEPVMCSGVFVHRRQRKLTFQSFKHLVAIALDDLNHALQRDVAGLESIPLFCTDGCGVLGPELEAWLHKAYHGSFAACDVMSSHVIMWPDILI